jgi:hypothetical protein
MNKSNLVVIAALAALSCGGGKSGGGAVEPVGESHVGDDLDVDEPGKTDAGDPSASDTGDADGGDTATVDGGDGTAAPAGPPVTFRLKNNGDEELVLSMDRGLQPILSAYSGTPPNAKSILMYPTHCTAACDVAEDARCPHCPKPKKAVEERESELREVIAPGATLDFPWDGQIHVYEKTHGTRDGKAKSCNCFTRAPAPAGTYTVRACGLRITKSAKKRSKYQCPTSTMILPAESGAQVVEFDFAKPE